jgi:hypothetical protein
MFIACLAMETPANAQALFIFQNSQDLKGRKRKKTFPIERGKKVIVPCSYHIL